MRLGDQVAGCLPSERLSAPPKKLKSAMIFQTWYGKDGGQYIPISSGGFGDGAIVGLVHTRTRK